MPGILIARLESTISWLQLMERRDSEMNDIFRYPSPNTGCRLLISNREINQNDL